MVYQRMKYVKRERGYWYYRRGAVRQRIEGERGTAEWLNNYVRIHNSFDSATRSVERGTFDDLAVQYLSSGEFKKLAPRTQKKCRRYTDMARRVFGDIPLDEIDMPSVVALRDKLADTPAKANDLTKQIRLVFGWGVPRGIVSHNPADFRHTSVKDFKTGTWSPWPEADVQRFIDEARDEVAWMTVGLLLTGQRIGDMIAMTWHQVKGDKVEVVQEKTGKRLLIPLHPELKTLLDVVPRRSVNVFTSYTGRVWTYSRWQESSMAERKRLGLEAYQTHGLRKNAVIRLLYAGCTEKEVGSITGQSRRMVEHYAKEIEQERLAKVAMNKYAEWSRR
jgi:integrase